MDKRKILLVCDRKNWAYDSIAKSLIKYNTNEALELETYYIKGGNGLEHIVKNYDLIFLLGWQLAGKIQFWRVKQLLPFIEKSKVITGIHSHHAWDNKASQPDKNVSPPKRLIDFLKQFRAVNAVSQRLYRIFKESGVENLTYTPNGVDTEIFKPIKPIRVNKPLVVGYSGSLKHDWRKGITEFMQPACERANVTLKTAMPKDNHYYPLERMPHFYNDVDLYLCASSSEGLSLSVLEALACGRPVISTRVGGCEDLIADKENGFLVDRNVDAIAEKLKLLNASRDLLLKMGQRSREIVEESWSWADKAKDWMMFIENNL